MCMCLFLTMFNLSRVFIGLRAAVEIKIGSSTLWLDIVCISVCVCVLDINCITWIYINMIG